ncbi:helix-turn-helix transcriptional regulator [Mitsuaria sp. GD03876]|uniref:helix-turn-helix domain-containing protein n=1 Tax=Mitsuaria sp. GD03876 TaxID=2975399 RepID=UPI00244AAE32|nr:helix-turn-helix transcriptional regulator [Mitsuaria sp. GD03876]MDH0866467.1 helix-turn-helix transcriptional regulator [Mitsuaria sp. GD03876]
MHKLWSKYFDLVNEFGGRLSTFGERLREERIRLGLNQIDFGALGSVTKSTQINYEKGERSPDADYLMTLIPHGVDVVYLLTGEHASVDAARLTPDQLRLISDFAILSLQDREVALRVVSALGQVVE